MDGFGSFTSDGFHPHEGEIALLLRMKNHFFPTALVVSFLTTSLMADETKEPLAPFRGVTKSGADRSTLTGKVMAGYQGWFNCPQDGSGLGWTHWARQANQPFGPGNITVDLWPDMSEATVEEHYPTHFRMADGSPATVFSSHNRLTVLRHFRWMREYGIDGVFVQRFANGLQRKDFRHHKDVVLSHCREGANLEGRAYAVMYDLSGLAKGETQQVADDWKMLREKMEMGMDPAYLQHEGKPLVAIWGIGFGDDRAYTLTESRKLIEFFKAEGCSVMLGVPSWWRTQTRDATPDPKLHEALALADVISPWTPGRYRTPESARSHALQLYPGDLAWCRDRSIDFLPVVFPGFSWKNLKPARELDSIPRLEGRFLWSQFIAAQKSGAQMVYVAMFDEVDEGTAIFKCSNHPPVGDTPFLTFGGFPSDHYLWLTGEGGNLIRGERTEKSFPVRPTAEQKE
ncbi:hypothetical protein GCM10007100_19390 [Roseibacillus persicicus]|uniref:Xylosidase/arabinosidase n=2 Tax=Roseibacillus persicicus TaxID=454148 RepID=A0A918TM49_9BACT|nr:hypothetical protein GCM10007100_19390 [Roseibacillus persicicus]